MSTQGKVIHVVESNQGKLMSGILLAGGAYLAYRFGKKLLEDLSKGATQSLTDDSPAVRQAMNLRNAVNPSGINWMKGADGSKEQLALDTARQITNLDDVQKAYRNLYQDNLLDDLQRELSSDDYSKFLTLVSSNQNKDTTKGGAAATQFAKKSSLVVAKKAVTIRRTPDASNHGAFYEVLSENNIIKTAKPGEFIGYATGKQHFDEKNNVKFIEVGFVVNGEKAPASEKGKNKQKIVYWVSSSSTYVDIFEYYKPMFERYPDTLKATPWMKPLDFFEQPSDKSVKGLPMPWLITSGDADVLSDKFQLVTQVSANTLLGHLIMSMDTGKGRYLKFRTVDNTERWVSAHNIKVKEQ